MKYKIILATFLMSGLYAAQDINPNVAKGLANDIVTTKKDVEEMKKDLQIIKEQLKTSKYTIKIQNSRQKEQYNEGFQSYEVDPYMDNY